MSKQIILSGYSYSRGATGVILIHKTFMEGHLEYISISVNLKTEVISTTNQNIGKYHEESMGTQEQENHLKRGKMRFKVE